MTVVAPRPKRRINQESTATAAREANMARILILALAAGLAVSAPARAAVNCPDIVLPVCAVSPAKSALQTFNNACEANRAGFKVLHGGKCYGKFCARYCIINHGVVARGVVTGIERTYDNLCWAEKDWARFEHYGACPR